MSRPSIERDKWRWFWRIYLYNRPAHRYLSYSNRQKYEEMLLRHNSELFHPKEKRGNEDELYVPLEERNFNI